MHTVRFAIAAAIVAALPSFLVIRETRGQETITVTEESAMAGMDGPGGSACECGDVQNPPWHASVGGGHCGPVCRPHGVFHANPCGQLHVRRHLHHGTTLPPLFPRLHGLCAEGSMPTPQPLALPRCHQCGAVIAGGF